MVCIDVPPPMPVPMVLATRLGCTQRITSVGVKPADRNASTVATMFHTATRSMELAMSGLMPHTVGSNPVGIWPPTIRDSLVLRGTRISVPALRITCQSLESGTGRMTVCSGSNSTNAAGVGLRRHHEREVLVQEHRHQQRRGVVGVDRAVVDELADADSARPRCRGNARPARPRRPGRRIAVSYQPGWGSSSQRISPVVQASSSTPAADSSLSTSISKRVRDEPYGPSSAPPTMTTRSAGSTSRSAHSGGGAGV